MIVESRPPVRHRVMQEVDRGESLLQTLQATGSFEDLSRAYELAASWAEGVQRIADVMGAPGPVALPALDLSDQSRRAVVLSLRHNVQERVAWLERLVNQSRC